jgi:hypothetical protein
MKEFIYQGSHLQSKKHLNYDAEPGHNLVHKLHENFTDKIAGGEHTPRSAAAGDGMSDTAFRAMFKKVAMSRVYSDRIDEWATAKEAERINHSTEEVEKFDFQMALLWQLFSKELGM